MGRFWGGMRLISLMDEAVCGFVSLAILGLIESYGVGGFGQKRTFAAGECNREARIKHSFRSYVLA